MTHETDAHTNTNQHDGTGRAPGANSRRRLGAEGESLARRYLEETGYAVVDANWRCREGEIDLVAVDGDELVVVEVKTRRSRRYGLAVEAVTEEKHLRLRRLARLWAREHEAHVSGIRVDVIGVEWRDDRAVIDHRKRVIL